MKTWIRRLRGAISIGFLGSLTGAVITSLWTLGSMILTGGPIQAGPILFFSVLGVVVGGAAGVGFSVLVGAAGASRSLEEMTAWKAAFWGGAAGMVASLIGVYSVTGFLFRALPAAIPFVLFCVGAGSVLGSGVIRLAKSAKRRELEEAHELHGLPLNNPLDPFA